MVKMFDGFLDSLYKKWELYLFRLFHVARYVENQLKYSRINGPDLEDLLDPEGYSDSMVRIPPNPFWVRGNDRAVFLLVFDSLECRSEKEKVLKTFFREVWDRIGDIKRFVGITRNTRYIGENDSEKRLCNEIDIFIKYPEAVSPITRLVLGEKTTLDELYSFQRFLKDREHITNVKSYLNY